MNNNNCLNCPIRLFNKKHYNLQGVGNPFYGKVILIPNVDYNAYKAGSLTYSSQVEVITNILSSTGEVNNVYIVPLLRCNETISCQVNDEILSNCIRYFIKDRHDFDWHNIMVCGKACQYLLNTTISKDFNNKIIFNNCTYILNYNPLIKYVSDEKYEIFKDRLLKWYNNML